MTKRLLASLLAVLMVVSMIPLTAFAATVPESPDTLTNAATGTWKTGDTEKSYTITINENDTVTALGASAGSNLKVYTAESDALAKSDVTALYTEKQDTTAGTLKLTFTNVPIVKGTYYLGVPADTSDESSFPTSYVKVDVPAPITSVTVAVDVTTEVKAGENQAFPTVTNTVVPENAVKFTNKWTDSEGTEAQYATVAGEYTLTVTATPEADFVMASDAVIKVNDEVKTIDALTTKLTVAEADPTPGEDVEIDTVALTLDTANIKVGDTLPDATAVAKAGETEHADAVAVTTTWTKKDAGTTPEVKANAAAEAGEYDVSITVTANSGYKLASTVAYTLNGEDATLADGAIKTTATVKDETTPPAEKTAITAGVTLTDAKNVITKEYDGKVTIAEDVDLADYFTVAFTDEKGDAVNTVDTADYTLSAEFADAKVAEKVAVKVTVELTEAGAEKFTLTNDAAISVANAGKITANEIDGSDFTGEGLGFDTESLTVTYNGQPQKPTFSVGDLPVTATVKLYTNGTQIADAVEANGHDSETNAETYTAIAFIKLNADAGEGYTLAENFKGVEATFKINKINLTNATVTISADTTASEGTIKENAVLTADITGVYNEGEGLTYQWQKKTADTFENIADATSKTYKLVAGDTEGSIKVVVTGATNYENTAESEAVVIGKKAIDYTVSVAPSDDKTKVVATITDGTGTAVTELSALTAAGLSLKWIVGDTVTDADNGLERAITDSDIGKTITAKLVPASADSDYTGEKPATGSYTVPKKTVTLTITADPTTVAATGGDVTLTVTADPTTVLENVTVTCSNEDITVALTDGKATVKLPKVTTTTTTKFTATYAGDETYEAATAEVSVKQTVSGGGGSGSGGGSVPTPGPSTSPSPTPVPTPEPPKATVEPDVDGGVASGKVDSDTIGDLITEAGDKGAGEVVVEVKPEAGTEVTEVKTELPAESMKDLADAKVDLTVSTPVADVTLPQESLKELGAGEGAVTVTAAQTGDENSATITVTVEQGDKAVETGVTATVPSNVVSTMAGADNGTVTVSTPVADVVLPNSTLVAAGKNDVSVSAIPTANGTAIEVKSNGVTMNKSDILVAVPAADADDNTVAYIVDANGNKTILPKSAAVEGEMKILLDTGKATITYGNNAKTFADSSNIPNYAKAAFTTSRELITGIKGSDGKMNFKPNKVTTRAELVTMLHRLESEPNGGNVDFDDMKGNEWYKEAAAWAQSTGVVTGTDTGFSGNKNISRQELATMLYRYMNNVTGYKGATGDFSGIAGGDKVSKWASEAMKWAYGSGILTGKANSAGEVNLDPTGMATRAEVSAMLERFVKLIAG